MLIYRNKGKKIGIKGKERYKTFPYGKDRPIGREERVGVLEKSEVETTVYL